MIADLDTAKVILAAATESRMKLNNSIHAVMQTESVESISTYKRAVGRIMGETFESIIEPIYRLHPELIPDGYEWLKRKWNLA